MRPVTGRNWGHGRSLGRRCHVSRGSSHLRQKTYGPRTLGGYHGPGPASSHGAAGEVRVLRLPAGWGAERETERPCTRRGGSASTRAPRLVLVSACRGAAGWLTWGKNLPSTRRCRKRTVLSGGGAEWHAWETRCREAGRPPRLSCWRTPGAREPAPCLPHPA